MLHHSTSCFKKLHWLIICIFRSPAHWCNYSCHSSLINIEVIRNKASRWPFLTCITEKLLVHLYKIMLDAKVVSFTKQITNSYKSDHGYRGNTHDLLVTFHGPDLVFTTFLTFANRTNYWIPIKIMKIIFSVIHIHDK